MFDGAIEDHRTRVARDKRARMRSRLVEAVVQVCSAPGQPGPAVVDDVMRAAGVSRGTFYKYFTSLEEALDMIGRELADEMTVGLLPVYEILTDPLERTAVGLQTFLRRGAVDPVWARVVSRTDHLFDDAELVSRISIDLTNGRASGVYDFASIESAVDFVLGSTMGGVRRFQSGGVGTAQVIELGAMVLRGLGADPARTVTALHKADAHLRARAPDVLPWWRDLPDAAPRGNNQKQGGTYEPSTDV